MKVNLTGKDKAIKKFLKKERLWLKRNGIKIDKGEETKPEINDNTDIKEDQTIMFDNLKAKKMGNEAFNLEAESTSELPVLFVSSDDTIAKIKDSEVTILKIGTVIITASQSGNDKFNPAEDVARELVIKKKNFIG